MKKLVVTNIFLLSIFKLFGQINLVPNSGFEDRTNIQDNFSDENPKIPCRWGGFDDADLRPIEWNSFGHPPGGSNRDAPDLFDSRQNCSSSFCQAYSCNFYFPYQHGAYVSIPENYYENNPGNSDLTSQNHRTTIDWQNGGNTIGRYIGLKTRNGHNPGIYCKLKKPLKCGYTYTLRFYGVKKSPGNGSDKLQIRFCKSDSWNDYAYLDGNLNKKELHSWITENGGTNHDQWEEETFDFYVSEPNVEYLFIRCGGGNVRVILDDIEILDQCAEEFACDRTINNYNIDIYSNNFHALNNPLTFFNTEYQKEVTIEIFTVLGQFPIRTIHVDYPCAKIAWDGKDENGNEVANGNYVYRVRYGTACVCKELSSNFVKIEPNPCFDEIYWNVDPVTGCLTFYNLDNVGYMNVTIYDDDGNYLTDFEVYSPRSTIAWNGRIDPETNSGPVISIPNGEWCDHPTDLIFTAEFRSECCIDVYENKSFTQVCFADPTNNGLPQFSFKPVDKEIECEFNYNYNPCVISPIECCGGQLDLFLEDVTLYGEQDFILIRDIQAGPKVIVEANADILFQAGREIRLIQDFYTEPGAEFLAKIDPDYCQRIIVENGPIEFIRFDDLSEVSIEKMTINSADSSGLLKVYPNPTTNDIYIQSEFGIINIDIFDLTGKKIGSESYLNSNLVKLEAVTLMNGIYILQITLEDGSIEVRKVIKN